MDGLKIIINEHHPDYEAWKGLLLCIAMTDKPGAKALHVDLDENSMIVGDTPEMRRMFGAPADLEEQTDART